MIAGTFFPARPPVVAGTKMRRVCADLAVLTTATAALGLFLVSPVTLEYFNVAYITSGGGAASKFHPSTMMAVAAFALRCLATGHPLRTGWRLVTNDSGAVVLGLAAVIATFYAAVLSKTPVTPLVDSFFLPILFFLLLRDLDAVLLKWIALLLVGLLCVNAVMALIEFARGAHFLTLQFPFNASSDPTRSDAIFDWRVDIAQDWRAVALLGHPLVNGLIVGCFIMCLAAPGSAWLPGWIAGPVLLLQCASMFAFGARASLVMSGAFAMILALQKFGDAVGRGERLSPRVLAIVLVMVAVAIGVGEILIESGFFDRTIDRFYSDAGSAETRSTMFELFHQFSWSDLLLKPDQDVVATYQRVYGLEFGIESSWVGLALTYGLIVTAIIMIGLFAFSRSVVRVCGRGTALVLAFFFISVSATASLSGKTTSLAMAVVLVLLFLRRDERRMPLRSALGLEAV